MPRRQDISSVLVLGAGPVVIGQACEFDYSGVQAVKALKAEGLRVILANSNPATIMTDPDLADATYLEPLTLEFAEQIIARERPDAILPTMGGQTALNLALALYDGGVLERHGVRMIGADARAIRLAEDRFEFRKAMDAIGLSSARARLARDPSEAAAIVEAIGLPLIVRPSFTLGGEGGGVAYNRDEAIAFIERGLRASPISEALVEESLLGWKEFEMEAIRDRADNGIIVCSIENIDPMGVHTGDSITVAPALTLTDKEYQRMRDATLGALRAVGVETGGANVQFAVNPVDGRLIVIEMNPRVSRSSALASKATGFPIAKVAARLAIGYTLDELANDITQSTPASFEPTLDYVVVKVPRFAFEKFPDAPRDLGSSMRAVGESMAIGRTFPEALQKAFQALETGQDGLEPPRGTAPADDEALRDALARPLPERLLLSAEALRRGFAPAEVVAITHYDPWFVDQICMVVEAEAALGTEGLPATAEAMRRTKAMGFSDARLASLTGTDEATARAARHALGVHPIFRRVDTCAGEFASATAYMYGCYDNGECEAAPSDRPKAIILGAGPNRIGQGLEFDYCCCQASYACRDMGVESIMINSNPETVSTDYDTSDRLYFEPLTAETALEVLRVESTRGTMRGLITQFGGQTPLRIARALENAGAPLLGGGATPIDKAEDRDSFRALLESIGLQQPPGKVVRTPDAAVEAARALGMPVLVRPSWVLGGRGMEIAHTEDELRAYMTRAQETLGGEVLVDIFLDDAVEVDVDAVRAQDGTCFSTVMEHIEAAGVHSGDSACVIPPHTLDDATIAALKEGTKRIADALGVVGMLNVQFAAKDGEIYVLEANPRASRTTPFASKAIGAPLARMAARAALGDTIAAPPPPKQRFYAIKEAVFPFARFPGADTTLGPEMRSTGEAMGMAMDFPSAFAKSQIAASAPLPTSGCAFISVRDADKAAFVPLAQRLAAMGFALLATHGCAKTLTQAGIAKVEAINKVREGRPHILDAFADTRIALVFNTTQGARAIADSRSLRRAALVAGLPYVTTLAGARAAVDAIEALRQGLGNVMSLQEAIGR